MNTLVTIIAFSTLMWYLIDRVKPLWAELSWGRYLTCAIAAACSAALTFTFSLDLLPALELTQTQTAAGRVITALIMMSGSSAVAEITEKLKG